MKIGLLGGTFDPPHLGHLHMAGEAQRELCLDRVLFVPCNRQPLKKAQPVASPCHRLAMVALALASNPGFLVEPMELERGGISYTVETLEALKARRPPDSLFFIIGSDTLSTLPRWLRFKEIFELAEVVVVPRSGFEPSEHEAAPGDAAFHLLSCPPVAISASAIRKRLKRGDSIDGLVPPVVANYITRQGLYRLESNKEDVIEP